jgi:hypothetical protein
VVARPLALMHARALARRAQEIAAACAADLDAAAAAPPPPPGASLETELAWRFPIRPPGEESSGGGDEGLLATAAKRCVGRLLAWQPAPHVLSLQQLGGLVRDLRARAWAPRRALGRVRRAVWRGRGTAANLRRSE